MSRLRSEPDWPYSFGAAGDLDVKSQVCLDKLGTGVNVYLAKNRVAGVDESMRRVRGNDNDAPAFTSRCSFPTVMVAVPSMVNATST